MFFVWLMALLGTLMIGMIIGPKPIFSIIDYIYRDKEETLPDDAQIVNEDIPEIIKPSQEAPKHILTY